ncbi:anchored repeat ABC transporter substrate-binding protein [Actinoalloteichus hoggarensis]|uniref:Periplasmic zinc-binding protein TroA n=1 Tax=Actinoalloteichus hoggarensis TaxID=1470176 RepID=A0A221W7G9_9PSEU|nr:anchored repeat ABC transporter, substrate-binding protein [Actinoalloteichus hoggarensis]ASO21519.1 Periplasmic zinc-binding protein TroA precursor [Actinoalloteichus hoggarensis]MBB5922108.1 anchored repeat ABC transporter substrate-binding protein [Actinoalloteichus hoggarensis]
MRIRSRACRIVAGLATLSVLTTACAAGETRGTGEITVITTTEILADLVASIGGDRVEVSSLVPAGGDPHSYEPSPADAARVAEADVAFTNHLLLEEQALIKTVDVNLPSGALNVSLAEVSETYGAHVIPLVENIALDVLWLGLRVRGTGEEHGATRTSEIGMTAVDMTGPGDLFVYLTQALGSPDVYFGSADGFDDADRTTLPPAAHTHVNWAFTEPGEYELTLAADLDNGDGDPRPLGEGTFRFAVGVDPHTIARDGQRILDAGHTDVTVDLDTGELYAFVDAEVGTDQEVVPAVDVVIDVPNRALEEIPDDARFTFLGEAGKQVFQLPQAVLGKHVHGEIDPHLWQDVRNAKAYVQLMLDTLIEADPEGAQRYETAAGAYLAELDELHAYVGDRLATIPPERRQLITTHDAFGYLAEAYDMTVAGFVVPNPAQEPSVEQVSRLTETIRNLEVPAVFMEPNLVQRADVLTQVAHDQGVEVCTIYGDAFDENTTDYVSMMRHNADELVRCLGDGR